MRKIIILITSVFSSHTYAENPSPCNQGTTTKYFISNWHSQSDSTDTLTTITMQTGETFITDGRIVFSGDINGDNNNDAIFKSFEGSGSSGENTFDILIKCHGYYTYAGGDYYADIEVSNEADSNNYKKIKAYSYKRDTQSKIIYNEKEAELESTILSFNPTEMKYIRH